MLRMRLRTASSSTVITLEGTLTGLWSKELLRIARQNEQGGRIIFDIQGLSFIDPAGREALQILGKRGAGFVTNSSFGRELCDRLRLRRVKPLEMESDAFLPQPGARTFSKRELAPTIDGHNKTVADKSPRPLGCGD